MNDQIKDLPPNLPPVPEPPAGHRWEYRGLGWNPQHQARYSYIGNKTGSWDMGHRTPDGWKDFHYLEAVKIETPDYTSPEYRARVEAACKQGWRIESRDRRNPASVFEEQFSPAFDAWMVLDYRIHPDDEAKFTSPKATEQEQEPDSVGPAHKDYQDSLCVRWRNDKTIRREWWDEDDNTWESVDEGDEHIWDSRVIYREAKPKPEKRVVPLDDYKQSELIRVGDELYAVESFTMSGRLNLADLKAFGSIFYSAKDLMDAGAEVHRDGFWQLCQKEEEAS